MGSSFNHDKFGLYGRAEEFDLLYWHCFAEWGVLGALSTTTLAPFFAISVPNIGVNSPVTSALDT
jgi:hypothetical protein